ncbi:glycerophosphodiester phosphodiesterase family protein [Malonomonas rubra]|uniref:glycerophosphodiester phosphodiesterase n=1 Tax=Malonomonas rubra TaxID=57040 RepID=UPI0026ED04BE|nr:glycerophosphodiester phosphodiesterase family protein [Malonomonas rubra]
MSEFLIIAHRGASGRWPENTLLAFSKALEYGVEWLELDIHLSADGELVVIHDFTLERTTDGCGQVSDYPLAELRLFDAGMGEKIPLLAEVLDLAAGRATVNIELKGAGTGAALGLFLQQRFAGQQCVDKLLASSLNGDELINLSTILPYLPLAVVAERADEQLWRLADDLGAWSVNLDKCCIDEALRAVATQHGKRLLAFTVNDDRQLQQLQRWGVDGAFTDFPERFVAK